MTKLEQVTLFKWMHREIHLDGPPRFLTETYTSAEQDVFADYDRNHMGYRLYGILLAGIKFSEGNPKYNFCNTALLANRDGPTRTALESMLLEAQVITSDPKSKIVVLRYTRPEQRDQLCGLTFKMGAGTVTMQATDSLTTDLPRVGMDDSARALLYQVHARGHSSLSHAIVRAVFAAAAKMDVFDVKSEESPGIADFSLHKWVVAFAQITCPAALALVRRLEVSHGDQRLIFDIQHPRAIRRAPCSKCLSIRHGSNSCTNKQVQQSLQRHTLQLEVVPTVLMPKLTAALSPPALKQQLQQLRKLAAPDLETRLRREKKEKKAEAKQRVAHAAAQVARDAAREARLVAAAKRHEEEDRARYQLRGAQKAQREVTQQLAALQRVARASNAEEWAYPSEHQGRPVADGEPRDSAQGVQLGGVEVEDMADASGDETERSTSSEQGAECNTNATQSSSVTTAERAPPAINYTAGDSDYDARMQDAVDKQDGENGEAEGSTAAVPSAVTEEEADTSTHESRPGETSEATLVTDGNVVDHATESNTTRQLSETIKSDRTATKGVSDMAESALVESASQAWQADPGPHADGQSQEADAGTHVSVTALLASTAGPPVTGKRTTPPSPSSSDDESFQQAKWAQGLLTSPFSADISPIAGNEDAPLLLDDAASRPPATRSGRRQLPPLPGDESVLLVPADQRPKRRQKAMSEFDAPETLTEAKKRLEREIAARALGS